MTAVGSSIVVGRGSATGGIVRARAATGGGGGRGRRRGGQSRWFCARGRALESRGPKPCGKFDRHSAAFSGMISNTQVVADS
jgi:hypothetical protein